MTAWKPATTGDVTRVTSDQLLRCSEEQRQLFQKIAVPIRAHPIDRSGHIESVFVVARIGETLLFWEDAEEGFELAVADSDGVIREHGASQFELSHIMLQIQNGRS